MTVLHIDRIAELLDLHEPLEHEVSETTREAAVAAILKPGEHTEALFILRASKDGDPWSGHMAFPGGHKDATDLSVRHTAERETWEEIGLDLTQHARYLGQLDQVRANPRGRNIDMVVTPVVYLLESDDFVLKPNHEVADVLWGSLNDMYRGHVLDQRHFHVGTDSASFPGYTVGEQFVWGLTFRMLEDFFSLLDPDYIPRGS
ncbi:MAG: CoA pyrophosphatase [Pseudomonadales bacterium]|nr:CoA pyrophosphatase [Pseudomonadales bacterium]